jgi:ERCC4 domain-containing protein
VEHRALSLGDYSIAGMEDICVVERKNLPDLVRSFTVERQAFVNRLRRMQSYPHRLLVVTTRVEPGQVAISVFSCQTQPDHAVTGSRVGWITDAISVHGDP